MGKKDKDPVINLAKQMGDASRAGDADKLAKLAAQIPRDENGQYITDLD